MSPHSGSVSGPSFAAGTTAPLPPRSALRGALRGAQRVAEMCSAGQATTANGDPHLKEERMSGEPLVRVCAGSQRPHAGRVRRTRSRAALNQDILPPSNPP